MVVRIFLFLATILAALVGGSNLAWAQTCPESTHEVSRERVGKRLILKCACQPGLVKREDRCVAADSVPTFALTAVKSEGEFYILTEDGRKLIGQNAAQVPISSGAKVITGRNGRVEMSFPDGTTLILGPDSQLVLDEVIYDPSTGVRRIAADLTKGLFRWVTGHVVDQKARLERVKLGFYTVGIRGTDFEAAILQDGSKVVKVFSGEVVLTPGDGRPSVVIVAGRMLSISSTDVITGPSVAR